MYTKQEADVTGHGGVMKMVGAWGPNMPPPEIPKKNGMLRRMSRQLRRMSTTLFPIRQGWSSGIKPSWLRVLPSVSNPIRPKNGQKSTVTSLTFRFTSEKRNFVSREHPFSKSKLAKKCTNLVLCYSARQTQLIRCEVVSKVAKPILLEMLKNRTHVTNLFTSFNLSRVF